MFVYILIARSYSLCLLKYFRKFYLSLSPLNAYKVFKVTSSPLKPDVLQLFPFELDSFLRKNYILTTHSIVFIANGFFCHFKI